MKKPFNFSSSILLLILILTGCQSQTTSAAAEKVNALLEIFLEETNITGLSAAVAYEDRIVYSHSFGLSDLDKDLPVAISTKYRIGSVAKLFTAVATVTLIENGTIEEDQPIQMYIRNLPEAYSRITVEQLAEHTAGVRHYTREETTSTNTREYEDLEEALDLFIHDPLLAEPGAKYGYSSYGYVLLGAVLENACEKKFADIIEEYVVSPAGLLDTVPEIYGTLIEGMSQFYLRSEGGFAVAEGENFSYKWPASGYLSTAEDLARFGSSLLSGEIVDTAYLPLLFSKGKTDQGEETNCGYGFRIDEDWRGRKVVHHGGESPGARAFLLIYPQRKLTVALLANVFRAPLFEGEAETIAGYFLEDFSAGQWLVSPGEYGYTAADGEKTMQGEILILDGRGTIHDFMGGTVSIVDIVEDHDQIRMIAVSKNGIINIWLAPGEGAYTGRWGYDKPQNEFSITK